MSYRGVSYHVANARYRAKLKARGKHIHLGYFTRPEVAARVFDCAKRLALGHGPYNFDGQPPVDISENSILSLLVKKGVVFPRDATRSQR